MPQFNHGTLSVSDTATYVGSYPIATGADGLLQNNGPNPVFLGADSVVADGTSLYSGFRLDPGEKLVIPANGSIRWDLYAITAVGTSNVSYLGQ